MRDPVQHLEAVLAADTAAARMRTFSTEEGVPVAEHMHRRTVILVRRRRRKLFSGIARHQLTAAVNAPGAAIARASRSAHSGVCPCARRNFDSPVAVPRLPTKTRSGMRGSWKTYTYQDAKACRLDTSALRPPMGCGVDNADAVAKRSGICAAANHVTRAPKS